MTAADWLRQKQMDRAKQLRDEWADEMGHDRVWWIGEAKRARTDWSSLLRQRLRVRQWVRDGRPPIGQWLRNAQAKLTK